LKKNNISSVYYTNTTIFEEGKYGFLKTDVINPDENKLFDLISQVEKYGEDLEVKFEGFFFRKLKNSN